VLEDLKAIPVAAAPVDIGRARRYGTFAAIMLVYVFYSFCWNTENFLRPYVAQALGLSRIEVSAFYTAQASGALFGAIILSQIADHYSRRNTLVAISIGIGLAALGVVFVVDFQTAMLQRFVMGFFLGGVFGCVVSVYVGLFSATVLGLLSGLVQLVYNGGDALLSWTGRHYDASNWQHLLQIGGCGAICAGIAVWLVVPSDRHRTLAARKLGQRPAMRELFEHGRWRLTGRLALMSGLNYFAFQSFNGWVTTYLREVHHYPSDMVGKLMTVLHVGSMLGAVVWGLVGDRYGRRANLVGFVLAALVAVVYMNVPPDAVALGVAGFCYGFCIVSHGIWGPYFAELYPEHLRATAASIINWGRVVSLFGSLLSGWIAHEAGLQTVMYIGGATYALAALLWWTLPETLRRKQPRG
jgi:MFS family permease